jgi:demethylmenaquinone methyltransferase / 2-methoxy-6-polyprenyl-1,4-benzoquinol methylase
MSRPTPGPTAPHPTLKTYYEYDADRESFVGALFDGAATHYDWVCRLMALGSGQFYRRQALLRTGLGRGMRLLDIATGTGLVARSAVPALGNPGIVIGLDASRAMLQQAVKTLAIPVVQGKAEALPFRGDFFDVASMGYALRHMADLTAAFRECFRVLKPGGRLLILEISRPRFPLSLWAIRVYLQKILPAIVRIGTRNTYAELLTKYYWDTIATCVPPETILALLQQTGFAGVVRRVYGGLFSEYVGRKPLSIAPRDMG